ncbi:MAG: single-stranded DNA-binding protein [Coriobacteriales bacterium]|jgi:single-strand DNA-binding protein|nr:single-stranded DNA-binding protein [Coriobacteriales bacterium]
MSANINKVILTGNLTRDSELRALPSGSSVLAFGIAVNDRRKNSSTGDWEDVPNYINCSMFGTRAEGLHKYLLKGTKVGIDGKLRWSSWEKDGQKHSKVDVTVDNLEFLSSRNNSEGGSYQAPAAAPAPSADSIPATPEITVYDADDIPF